MHRRILALVPLLATACKQYQSLVTSWKGTAPEPPELSEARTFLTNPACQGPVTPRP